ncbi:MAG TPA: MlaD family protein [Smithellaceae bacterium]|nr:MlaD family protein [Smithellaceae bacterium]
MFSLSSEAKVGLFVLVALIILGYMSFQVGQHGFSFKRGYLVETVFDNATGLDKDASVQIAGVEVGRVESISLKNGKALVVLRIKPDIQLEKDVSAAIRTHGILGDKYVEITPGTIKTAFIPDGGAIEQVNRPADIDRMLSQFALITEDIRAVTSSLRNVLGGEAGESSIREILTNMRELTRSINTVVARNDDKIADVVENLKSASKEMEGTFIALNQVAQGLKKGEGTLGQLLRDKETGEKLSKTISSLQDVTEKISTGKGTFGKLVNDEETAKNLSDSLAGINRYVNKAEQYRTYLSYHGEYLFDTSNAKSYLDVRIQPNPDKFYLLGVVTDPRGRRTLRDYTTGGVTTRVEEYDKSGFLFNAQIGKRFKDIAIRGGIMESTGGVGLEYFAFNDKLRLSFDAFDFSSDRRAHLKGMAEFQIFKYIYLSGGWDDFISNQGNSSPFAGISIRFEDDDLKYLMTTTPIPK